jgi:hypothetical protein
MIIDPYPEFAKFMGEPSCYATPTQGQLNASRTMLGDSFAQIIERDGFAFYREQRIRTVDPEALAPVARLWPLDGETGDIFMVTCFGDFFCWRGNFCWFVNVNELTAIELIDSMDWFLGSFLQSNSYLSSLVEGFKKAKPLLKKTPITADDVLAWTPALALGGSREESHLEVAKIGEAHSILAGSGPLQLHRY